MNGRTPRVEACIAAVMKRFPSDKSTAYFTEVHQELAPLARDMEIEAADLIAENEALRAENQRLWKLQASAAPDARAMLPDEPTDALLEGIMGEPWTGCGNGMRDLARQRYAELRRVAMGGKRPYPVVENEGGGT